MRKPTLAVLASFGSFLLLTGFAAQQFLGYDATAGAICAYDRASTPQCVPIGKIVSGSWWPKLGATQLTAVTGSGTTAVLAQAPTVSALQLDSVAANASSSPFNTGFGTPQATTPYYFGHQQHSITSPESALFVSSASDAGAGCAALGTCYKQAAGIYHTVHPGSASAWGLNVGVGAAAGAGAIGLVVQENDLNLYNQDYGSLPATASGPFAVAYAAVAGGSHFGHAGYLINGSIPSFNWGIALTDYTPGGQSLIQDADFYTNTKAPTLLKDRGARAYGVDLGGVYSGAAVRIPNNSAVVARNAANSADANILYLDGSNTLTLGAGASTIAIGPSVLPGASGTLTLGDSSHTFAAVYADRVRLTPVTIASLPACNSGSVGAQAFVSNGVTTPTYHLAVSATGTGQWPVSCTYNGSSYSWVY